MRIGLVDLKDPRDLVVDKTIAGGMGTATRYGRSGFADLLTRAKARLIRLLPYNVAYVSAILKAQGHDVVYRDRSAPVDYDAAVVFSAIPSRSVDAAFVARLRRRRVPALVTGTIAGVAPEAYVGAAAIIRGDPESFFLSSNWIDSLQGWESGPARLVNAPRVQDLDTLPFPDWSVFPKLESRYAVVSLTRTVLPVVTSRGCPYPCGYYCPYPLGEGRKMRFRSPDSVAREVAWLHERHQVNAIKFRDPIFTVNRDRTLALLDALETSAPPFVWGCETHLSLLDEPLLKRMAHAGCRMIQAGIETINPDALAASRRRSADLDHQRRMLEVCRDVGIKAAIYFIVGLPEDTLASMRANLEYGATLPAAYIQITACTPYPGTRFFEDVKDRLLTHDWRRFDQYTPVIRHSGFDPEDLVHTMAEGYRRFYLRPAWVRNFLATLSAGWKGEISRRTTLQTPPHPTSD